MKIWLAVIGVYLFLGYIVAALIFLFSAFFFVFNIGDPGALLDKAVYTYVIVQVLQIMIFYYSVKSDDRN